jgi:hypothetical protein
MDDANPSKGTTGGKWMNPFLGSRLCTHHRGLLFLLGLALLAALVLAFIAPNATAITWDEERPFTAGGTVAGSIADSDGDNLYYLWTQQGTVTLG